MIKQMTIEEFEQNMLRKQSELSQEEYDKHVATFWDYFHLAYCS